MAKLSKDGGEFLDRILGKQLSFIFLLLDLLHLSRNLGIATRYSWVHELSLEVELDGEI
jgi:hypothetical protein